MSVRLNLTDKQFLVIHELLMNVKLGDRNKFEIAISDLMMDMDTDVDRFVINELIAEHGNPEFEIVSSMDGFEIKIIADGR